MKPNEYWQIDKKSFLIVLISLSAFITIFNLIWIRRWAKNALNSHFVYSTTDLWLNAIYYKWAKRIFLQSKCFNGDAIIFFMHYMIICIQYIIVGWHTILKNLKYSWWTHTFSSKIIITIKKNQPNTIPFYLKRIQKRFVTLLNLFWMDRCGQQTDMDINE